MPVVMASYRLSLASSVMREMTTAIHSQTHAVYAVATPSVVMAFKTLAKSATTD